MLKQTSRLPLDVGLASIWDSVSGAVGKPGCQARTREEGPKKKTHRRPELWSGNLGLGTSAAKDRPAGPAGARRAGKSALDCGRSRLGAEECVLLDNRV